MSLETGVVNIADLVVTNPAAGDSKSEGDDHIRNIKKVLRNDFAGFTGAVVVTGVDGGAADAYTLTPANALPAYTTKMLIEFTPVATNLTTTPTINISGLGAKTIKSVANAALQAGDLVISIPTLGIYNGTNVFLIGPTKNYIDQIVVSNTLPGVSTPANAGKFYTTSGTVGSWASIDGRGEVAFDKGSSGTTAQVITYTDGEGQTLTATGSFAMSATGFPAGRIAGVILRLINGGAYTLTTSGITIIKADNTQTTTFSAAGITLQTSGQNMLLLFSFGDGTIYMMAH